MQKLITKYGLAAHLAILAVAPLFLSPIPVLWLSVLTAVWVVMEPSRIGNEMLHGARARVMRALVCDPLFWVLLALVALAGLRAVNDGVALVYDAEVAKWTIATPTWAILPGSATGGAGAVHFAMAVALWVVVTGCRHALGRAARFACALVAAAAAGLAVTVRVIFFREAGEAFVRQVACAWHEPASAGMAYGILWLLALVALVAAFERHWWRSLPLVLIGLIGSVLGLFLFAPAQVIVMFAGAGVVLILYAFVFLRVTVSRTADFRYLVVVGISLVLAGMVVLMVTPQTVLEAKVEPFLTGAFLPEGLLKPREALAQLSASVWKEHPWLGTGLGSFALDLNFYATAEDWRVISPLQATPLNGYWLLLVERGVIGAFFIAVPLVLLVIAYVGRLIGGLSALPHPLALVAPVVLAAVVPATLVDCSVLEPTAFLLTLAVVALSANAFGKKEGLNG